MVDFHHAITLGSSGSYVSSFPTDCGLPKSTEIATRTPQGRNASAIRAICGMNSGESSLGFALTLLIEQPLIPTDASRRPYSLTRDRSERTALLSQKIEPPP